VIPSFYCFNICDVYHAVFLGLNDISMEEVRLNAYEAKASGNLNAYVSMFFYFSRNCTVLF